MSQNEWIALGVALVCTIVASLLAASEAALQNLSRARADRLVDEGRRGSKRLAQIAADPAPSINTALFVRTIAEITAIVLVSLVVAQHIASSWLQLLTAAGSMIVVSYVLWGVAPRTIGRQKADEVALSASGPLAVLTTVLGPIPQLMILVGNAITPGRGFADGPFSTEAELRELVDMAEASEVIEAGERQMIHSVFELGDTIVKEVMVPRPDMVFIESSKTLRQGLWLALRSGFSRIPVLGEGMDDVVGILYLKDVIRRVYDNPDGEKSEKVSSMMRPAAFCPDSKPVDELLKDMQRTRNHMVIVVDEFGGTAGLCTIEDILEEIVGEIVDEYDPEPIAPQVVDKGYRVSSRMPVDDLGDLFGLELDDDDVETVGGVMAKMLNMVPIPGSAVEWEGLHIVAERSAGRRHQIDTCLVHRIEDVEVTPQPSDRVGETKEDADE
ncbi:MAG TPA: hemolysin family protein [Propionibacteriaceae bacterium]|nr:hemolysin family protein [Propionibacteriaceae bacterium]